MCNGLYGTSVRLLDLIPEQIQTGLAGFDVGFAWVDNGVAAAFVCGPPWQLVVDCIQDVLAVFFVHLCEEITLAGGTEDCGAAQNSGTKSFHKLNIVVEHKVETIEPICSLPI